MKMDNTMVSEKLVEIVKELAYVRLILVSLYGAKANDAVEKLRLAIKEIRETGLVGDS